MEPLIALPPDSRVSPPPLRASAEVRLILAGSGPKSCALFRSTNPLGCCLRMFLASSLWDSTPFSAIWTLRATKRGRWYFRLRRSARRTSGNASSLWLTPNACDENGGKVARAGATNTRTNAQGKKQQLSLKQQVRELAQMWPTPTSTAGDGRSEQSVETWTARQERTLREKGIYNGLPLNVAVKLWPTPVANDGRKMTPPSEAQRGSLTAALLVGQLWSTPAAQDAKNATLPASPATRDTLPGDLLREAGQTGVVGSLNPEWAETLMGYPEGWTALDSPLTSSHRATPGQPGRGSRSTSGSRRARPRSASHAAPHG